MQFVKYTKVGKDLVQAELSSPQVLGQTAMPDTGILRFLSV